MIWRCSITAIPFVVVVVVVVFVAFSPISQTEAVSTFQILSPPELANNPRYTIPRPWQRNETGIIHTPALFGNPPYGQTLIGNLFYPSQPGNQLGCQPFDLTNEPNWPEAPDPQDLPPGVEATPYVLLLRRGICSFITKVRNAQTAGAKVVIIMGYAPPRDYLLYMADDGVSDSVNTPSIFILNYDGNLLINALKNNTVPVTLAMTWSWIAPDDKVRWDLWTSSRDPDTFAFKKVFGDVEAALGDSTFFTPHYEFRRYVVVDANSPNCMNRGRYCVPDPNRNTPGLLGRDVVRENLRQVCLYRQLLNNNNVDAWWKYVAQFENLCSLPSQWATPACGDDIIKRLGGQTLFDQVYGCINNGTLDANMDATHPVIEEEIAAFVKAGNPFLPTVIINEEHYRGTIQCQQPLDISTCPILTAICAGFINGTQPSVCFSSIGCSFNVQRDACGVCGGDGSTCRGNSNTSSGVSIGAVIAIVIGGMLVIGIAIVIYMKRQKKQLHDGMDNMLRQYLPMEDNDSINNTDRVTRNAQHP